MNDTRNSSATLSFASGSHGSGKICLWSPAHSEDTADCNAEGRERADELLSYMTDEGAPFMLGHVLRGIAATGEWGPMEAGFAQRLAEYALAGEIETEVPVARGRPFLTLVEG